MQHLTRLVILIALGIVVIFVADHYTKKGSMHPATMPVKKFLKNNALDADSVRFLDWRITKDGNEHIVVCKWKAKNYFNAYITQTNTFTVWKNTVLRMK